MKKQKKYRNGKLKRDCCWIAEKNVRCFKCEEAS